MSKASPGSTTLTTSATPPRCTASTTSATPPRSTASATSTTPKRRTALTTSATTTELIKLRRWTKDEISNLKVFLQANIDLHELENLTTQEAANRLDELIKEGITRFVQENSMKKRANREWFTNGLNISRTHRLKLLRKSKAKPTKENIDFAKNRT